MNKIHGVRPLFPLLFLLVSGQPAFANSEGPAFSSKQIARAGSWAAGHAVAAAALKLPVLRISIMPDAGVLASVDRFPTPMRADLEKQITLLTAGGAAEEMLHGAPAHVGSEKDMRYAMDAARHMVEKGMGRRTAGQRPRQPFGDSSREQRDAEDLVSAGYFRARELISAKLHGGRALADALEHAGTLDDRQIRRIIDGAAARP